MYKLNLKNQKGFGILQVLAGMSMMFLIIYGVMSILSYSARKQKQDLIIANLQELQAKIEYLLNDKESWKNTLNDSANSSMSCLLNTATVCTAGAKPIKRLNAALDLNNPLGNVFVDNLPDWNTPTYPSGGFTEAGEYCTSFNGNPGAGNDACPFSYKIIWEPIAAEADPGFRIVARLIFNPSSSFLGRMPIRLGVMTNSVANDLTAITDTTQVDSTKKAMSGDISDSKRQIKDPKLGKYDVVVWRTANSNVQSFRVETKVTGSCSSALTARTGWVATKDPFRLISANGTDIIFNKMGTYDCDVVANAYAVNSFQVQLFNVTKNLEVGSGSSFAAAGTQSAVDFNIDFTLDDSSPLPPHTFQIKQSCETSTSGNDLGIKYDVTNDLTASMTCRLVD